MLVLSARHCPALTITLGSLLLAACGSGDGLDTLIRKPAPDGVYFSADDGSDGNELWYSDGTAGGTQQVEDIHTSGGESLPRDFVRVDGRVFFTATTSAEGRELWVTDGDNAGLVKDIFPGTGDGVTEPLTVFQDEVYFAADDSTGEELWRSDGTTAGTMKVIDLQSAPSGSEPRELTVVGSRLFFAAQGPDGTELYRTNGDASGTDLVEDINGSGSSIPSNLFAFDGILYFSADDGSTGQELWRSGGTAATTSRVADINSGSADSLPQKFHALNATQFVFQAFNESGPANGEPWISNGSGGGTSILQNINTAAGTGSLPSDWVSLGAFSYFMATVSGARELWRTNGTTTEQVAGTGGDDLTAYNGNLYYVAPSGSNPGINALWRSNGSVGNATEVFSFSASTSNGLQNIHGVFDNRLILSADGGEGEELWVSDGTSGGTTLVREINTSGGSDIRDVVIIK